VRKIKSYFFISLDGVVESPDKWHFPYFDDEMGAAVGAGFATADALLMGRVLYEEWAAYWPEHADEPFGDVMNSIEKYVVSSSLQAAEWQNAEIISGDVAQKLREIKAQDGGDITMSGSATTVRWLLREGLLDELNLLVHPIVVGDGFARLVPPDESHIPLELLSTDVEERCAEPQLCQGEGLRAPGQGRADDETCFRPDGHRGDPRSRGRRPNGRAPRARRRNALARIRRAPAARVGCKNSTRLSDSASLQRELSSRRGKPRKAHTPQAPGLSVGNTTFNSG
jgi:dihydrofolate reductase